MVPSMNEEDDDETWALVIGTGCTDRGMIWVDKVVVFFGERAIVPVSLGWIIILSTTTEI